MEKFINLKLSKELLKAIEDAGFKEPSEIQVKTIPLVLEGKDVIGSSSTGSGKTLAFGAGIIDKLKKGAGIQTLILTPTIVKSLPIPFLILSSTVSSTFTLKASQLKPGAIVQLLGKNLLGFKTPKYARAPIATSTTSIAHP